MGRMHSADIARRANKQASWIDDKLRWIKKYKPELWANSKQHRATAKRHGHYPPQELMYSSTILGCRDKNQNRWRVDADELIEIMTKKLGEGRRQSL